MWLLLSPITYKRRLRVLRPVRRPMTTLECVLLEDNNRALVTGPEIIKRWMDNEHLVMWRGVYDI